MYLHIFLLTMRCIYTFKFKDTLQENNQHNINKFNGGKKKRRNREEMKCMPQVMHQGS